ncbi:hypothetical protein GW829_14765, partial [bacterium]|nr:hypothetical protein [bacterium]
MALKKKLPQPSFTLFIVFSVLLPINASVIADQFYIIGVGASLYWMFVYLLMTSVWTFATWLFRSRFFSLTTLAALSISLVYFADLFNSAPLDLYLLMLSLSSLAGLGAVKLLEKWQDETFARPLFWLTQAQEILLLTISFFSFLYHYDESGFANGWWLATTAIWCFGAVFYFLSNWMKQGFHFRALAVISMMPLAWLFLNVFDPSETVQAISFLVWGILFSFSGEALHALKEAKFHNYG